MKSKLVDVLKDAVINLATADPLQDSDLLGTLDERIILGSMCLKTLCKSKVENGKTVIDVVDCSFPFDATKKEDVFTFTYAQSGGVITETVVEQAVKDLPPVEGGSAEELSTRQHAAALQASLLQVKMLPIEAPTELLSYSELKENCQKITEAEDAICLETLSATFERQKALQEQLRVAITGSTKSLKRVVTARVAAGKKKVNADKLAAEKKEKEMLDQKFLAAKEEKEYIEARKCFDVNFVEAGHVLGASIGTDEAFTKKKGEDKTFVHTPFKFSSLAGSQTIKKLLTDQAALLVSWKATVDKKPEEGARAAAAASTMQHALTLAQGLLNVKEAAGKLFDIMAPPADLKEGADKVHLFAYKEMYMRHWFEPDALGSLRVISSGQLILYAAAPGDLERASQTSDWLVGVGNVGADVSTLKKLPALQRAVGIMRLMNPEIAKKLSSVKPPCRVHSFTVLPNEAIYIPAGFLVSAACANNTPVCGLRSSMLVDCSPEPLMFLKDSDDKGLAATAVKLLNSLST